MAHGVNGAGSEALGRVALELCSRPPEVEEGTGAVGPAGSDCEGVRLDRKAQAVRSSFDGPD